MIVVVLLQSRHRRCARNQTQNSFLCVNWLNKTLNPAHNQIPTFLGFACSHRGVFNESIKLFFNHWLIWIKRVLPTSFSKNKKRQECCYKWSNRAMLVRVNWTRDTQEVDSVWYRHIIYEGVEITSVTGQITNEFSNLCPFHCCSNSVRHTGTVRKYKKARWVQAAPQHRP